MSRLGDNIRGLRKAYGETQEELGFAIGVEKNTISSYETGRTEPGKEILAVIASHYLISVDELLLTDLSNMEKIVFEKNDINIFWKNISIIFPGIRTSASIENKYFKKAIERHRHFFEEVKMGNLEFDDFDLCMEEYLEAYEDEKSKEESAANIIGLCYLFIFIFKMAPKMLKTKPVFMTKLASLDSNLKMALENVDTDYENDMTEIAEDFNQPEVKKMLREMKVVIKRSSKLYELADYYLAIEFVFGIVDNDLEYELNRRIGAEMLEAFASVGNRYARRFLKLNYS